MLWSHVLIQFQLPLIVHALVQPNLKNLDSTDLDLRLHVYLVVVVLEVFIEG